jgi:hypothetical protein
MIWCVRFCPSGDLLVPIRQTCRLLAQADEAIE